MQALCQASWYNSGYRLIQAWQQSGKARQSRTTHQAKRATQGARSASLHLYVHEYNACCLCLGIRWPKGTGGLVKRDIRAWCWCDAGFVRFRVLIRAPLSSSLATTTTLSSTVRGSRLSVSSMRRVRLSFLTLRLLLLSDMTPRPSPRRCPLYAHKSRLLRVHPAALIAYAWYHHLPRLLSGWLTCTQCIA